jgi:hypothetical protein
VDASSSIEAVASEVTAVALAAVTAAEHRPVAQLWTTATAATGTTTATSTAAADAAESAVSKGDASSSSLASESSNNGPAH